jgi:hypothetical protein
LRARRLLLVVRITTHRRGSSTPALMVGVRDGGEGMTLEV